MIVVAIIGVLAALGYPSYRKYVMKARRTEAWSKISQIATLEEQYYATHLQYATDLNALGWKDDGNPKPPYAFALTGEGQAYTITATPQNAQANDICGNLGLDHLGNKSATGANDKNRWQCLPE